MNHIKKIGAVDIVINLIMVLVILMMLLPFVYIVSALISGPRDVYTNPAFLFPKSVSFATYETLFKVPWVIVGYRNSILYTVGGTLINVLVTFCAAFALSKRNLFGKRAVQFLIVLPGAVSTYNLLITRTYLQSNIPDELHDAAEIDGAHEYSFFGNVVLPLRCLSSRSSHCFTPQAIGTLTSTRFYT